jgi:hypothetical protein
MERYGISTDNAQRQRKIFSGRLKSNNATKSAFSRNGKLIIIIFEKSNVSFYLEDNVANI